MDGRLEVLRTATEKEVNVWHSFARRFENFMRCKYALEQNRYLSSVRIGSMEDFLQTIMRLCHIKQML